MTNTPSPTDEDRELIEALRCFTFGEWERLAMRKAADRLESLDAECERAWSSYRMAHDQAMSNGEAFATERADRAKLEEALQRLEQIVGITLDKDFGFWSSSAQNERRAELYPAWVYAKRTLDALNRSTDRAT